MNKTKRVMVSVLLLVFVIVISLLPFSISEIQNQFNDNSISRTIGGAGEWNYVLYVKIPKYAVISNAVLNLTGQIGMNSELNTTSFNVGKQGFSAYYYRDNTVSPPLNVSPTNLPIFGSGVGNVTNSIRLVANDGSATAITSGANEYGYGYMMADLDRLNLSNLNYIYSFNFSGVAFANTQYEAGHKWWVYNFSSQSWESCTPYRDWDVNGRELENCFFVSPENLYGSVNTTLINGTVTNNTLNRTYFLVQNEEEAKTLNWDYVNLDVAFHLSSFPSNVSLDAGNDGDLEFINAGEFLTKAKTPDFSFEINSFLLNCIPDDEGFCDVPLKVSGTNGNVIVDAVEMTYVEVPRISIISPPNNSNSSNANLPIEYIVSDTNLESCWWTNDLGTSNYSLTCGVNITGQTWNEGVNTIIIYANDSAGNINFSSVTFTLDATYPIVNIIFPQDYSNFSYLSSINVSYNASDLHLSSCWWTLNSGIIHVVPCNQNITIPKPNPKFNFPMNITFTIYANDTFGNVGFDIAYYKWVKYQGKKIIILDTEMGDISEI